MACLERSEGGGSHQQGVSVLIQLKRFQLRFYHHVAEGGRSMPLGRLEQLALVVSRSLNPTSASRPADSEPPTPAAALDPGALKPIMVGIGAQMAGIHAALWQEDYPAVSKLAQAIAQHPRISRAEVDRIKTTLGDEYVGFVQDDHRVHRTAARLAGAASARDEESTLDELATLQRGCVACHTHYRFKLAR